MNRDLLWETAERAALDERRFLTEVLRVDGVTAFRGSECVWHDIWNIGMAPDRVVPSANLRMICNKGEN